jgi:hypothetical protein
MMSTEKQEVEAAKKELQRFLDEQVQEVEKTLLKRVQGLSSLTSRVYTLDINLKKVQTEIKKKKIKDNQATPVTEDTEEVLAKCVVEQFVQPTIEYGELNAKDAKYVIRIQRAFRRYRNKKLLRELVEVFVKSPHAKEMRQRNNVIREIEKTEKTYVEGLMLAKKMYLQPLRHVETDKERFGITLEELDVLFINLEQILTLHRIFLAHLEAEMSHWPVIHIGDVFVNQAPLVSLEFPILTMIVLVLHSIHQFISRICHSTERNQKKRT